MSDYYIIDTAEKLKQAMEYLQMHQGIMSFDCETTSVNTRKCELLGISLSICSGEAFYIVVKDYPKQIKPIKDDLVEEFVRAILQSPKRQLVAHNAAFDVLVLRNTLGIDVLLYLFADTLLCKHLVSESRPHDLKSSALKYLGVKANEQEDLRQSVLAAGGKWTKNDKQMYLGDTEILGRYSAADADMTLQLFFKFWEEMEKQNLVQFYQEESHPLLKVTINHLLSKGVYCDIPYFQQLKTDLSQQMVELESKAHKSLKDNYGKHYDSLEMEILEKEYPLKRTGAFVKELVRESGINENITKSSIKRLSCMCPDKAIIKWQTGQITDEEFQLEATDLIYNTRKKLYKIKHESPYVINLASTKVLKTLIFDKLGESPIKKTKKDNAQVDEEVMDKFAEEYEWIGFLMEWRKVGKLLSTYVEPILEKNENGIIYCDWMQHGTDSGRFAVRNPNFQTLPRDDKRIKQGIIAPEGDVLVASDYSQLEPRCFSHLSSEPLLIESFKQGIDVYGAIAVDLWRLPCEPSEVKEQYPNERQIAKTILLALAYGLKKWHLSKILQCEVEQAEEFIDNFWQTYTNLDAFVKRSHATAYIDEAIRSKTGRVRHLDGLLLLRKNPDMAKRLGQLLNISVNFQVQSLAASITNRATIKLAEAIQESGLNAYICLQVHDELVCCARKDQAEQVAKIMKECMENAYTLKVPLIAEPKIGNTLAETK